MMDIDIFMSFLINLRQSSLRINPGQPQNNQLFLAFAGFSQKYSKRLPACGNKSTNIVTGGKRHRLMPLNYKSNTLCIPSSRQG